ncbi:cell division control protein 42-like [Tropilaelaps mercedesae]|uniref:Cell division control protein 42-like n=1 Tax=Tropilaelaps mercedesae TaxID=418985 RepID=A0A1V9X5B6_9ACAR|nr:cell division control protein 42-like [Tropilaelaps mercedesae]
MPNAAHACTRCCDFLKQYWKDWTACSRLITPCVFEMVARKHTDSTSSRESDSMQSACCGELHCVAVGDANSGKKHLLRAYERLDGDRQSSMYMEYHTCKVRDNFLYKFVFTGFSGQERFRNLRRVSYLRPTGVFLVCFSVVDIMQFTNAITSWVHELRENAPHSPFLLVGTHCDLRDEAERLPAEGERGRRNFVSRRQGEAAARDLNCHYVECSSTTLAGIEQVFDEAIRLAVKGPVAEMCRKMCLLM